MTLKATARALLRRTGFDVVRWPPALPSQPTEWPDDFDASAREIIDRVQPFTMTSPERLFALIQAVRYVEAARVPGAIVECGVWKGGSMMAVALTLKGLNESRPLFLYDTFEGMTEPNEQDVDLFGTPAAMLLGKQLRKADFSNTWAYSPLTTVRAAMASTGYNPGSVHFVPGRVEDTMPRNAPEQISVLRLDTDWYASTRHELEHLYPRLSARGVLIIDDYGHFAGARQAVDEYLQQLGEPLLLSRIDYTGRMAVKP